MFVSKTQFICRKFQNLIKILQFFCQDGSFTGMCVTVHKTQNWDKIPEQVLHFLVVLLILFIYFAYLSVCLYSQIGKDMPIGEVFQLAEQTFTEKFIFFKIHEKKPNTSALFFFVNYCLII